MTIFGVILFVILPLPGTGSIGGIIVSRLVGLSRSMSFIAVFIGTAIGTYAMAIGASTLIDMFSPIRDSAWFGGLRFSVLGLIVFLLSQLGRRKNTEIIKTYSLLNLLLKSPEFSLHGESFRYPNHETF